MKSATLRWTAAGWQCATPIPARAQLVFVFGASALLRTTTVRRSLSQLMPEAALVGCSTAGEILDSEVTDDGLVAMAIEFATTTVRCTCRRVVEAAQSFTIGRELATDLVDDGLRHVLVISEGLKVNGAALANGLREALPCDISGTGGLAGDGARFAETMVMLNDDVESGLVVAVGFYGPDIEVGWASAGGWDAFGPRRLVTRAQDNILFELDGQPALTLYKSYLGDRAAGLPSTGLLFPLELLPARAEDPSLVRTILAVDEAQQSVTFAGDVPEGRYVRLMKSSIDKLIWGAEQAGHLIQPTRPVEAVLMVSCVGRRLLLDQRTEEEIEAVLTELKQPAGAIGFYSYGEIGPAGLTPGCELHNQTMTLTTFAERGC